MLQKISLGYFPNRFAEYVIVLMILTQRFQLFWNYFSDKLSKK